VFIENYSTSKPLKVCPEKSHILSCDTVVANERYKTVLFNVGTFWQYYVLKLRAISRRFRCFGVTCRSYGAKPKDFDALNAFLTSFI
jgi:hypothetical protein